MQFEANTHRTSAPDPSRLPGLHPLRSSLRAEPPAAGYDRRNGDAAWPGDATRSAGFCYGSLNLQIEHHLFPRMTRNNLPRARAIVRQFCEERGVPYHETSVPRAVWELLQFLHQAGVPLRNPLRAEGRAVSPAVAQPSSTGLAFERGCIDGPLAIVEDRHVLPQPQVGRKALDLG